MNKLWNFLESQYLWPGVGLRLVFQPKLLEEVSVKYVAPLIYLKKDQVDRRAPMNTLLKVWIVIVNFYQEEFEEVITTYRVSHILWIIEVLKKQKKRSLIFWGHIKSLYLQLASCGDQIGIA